MCIVEGKGISFLSEDIVYVGIDKPLNPMVRSVNDTQFYIGERSTSTRGRTFILVLLKLYSKTQGSFFTTIPYSLVFP